MAFDPEHRLVVRVVLGKRTLENTEKGVQEFHDRTGGRVMNLITSDEDSPDKGAILNTYGEQVTPPRTGKPGRPTSSCKVPPKGLNYATVHKTRENGRVVKGEPRIIFGTIVAVLAAVAKSAVSRAVNIAFVERHNGTDRNRNARKVRKTYCFSKNWNVHAAVTDFTMYSYNFTWPVRTLRVKGEDSRWQARTPAMSAGLPDHPCSLHEWLTLPAVQRE